MSSYHYLFKFIVIGNTGVGKSCIVLQFIQNKLRLSHDITIGVQFGAKIININGKKIKLQIWDTVQLNNQAGQQNFRSITRSYYRSAIGALLVYDVTRRDSFQQLQNWLEQVKLNGNPSMQILLIGNKSDLQQQYNMIIRRKVSTQEGIIFAGKQNLRFIQTSAKDFNSVEKAFNLVAQEILEKIINSKIPLNGSSGIKVGDLQSNDNSIMTNNLNRPPIKPKNQNNKCC